MRCRRFAVGRVLLCLSLCLLGLSSCSTYSGLAEDEKLFIGLKKITFAPDTLLDSLPAAVRAHREAAMAEVDAALQTKPNGSLFGSSYVRLPSVGLWIWNACHNSKSAIGKWFSKTFGSAPVLMSNVNPQLRAQVAENILKNNGYFSGKVTYEIIETSKPKKQKISYHIDMGSVHLVDTLLYTNFPDTALRLIRQDSANAVIHRGTPFSAATLEEERNRVTKLLRNSGYYYYQPSYATYLADTISKPGWAEIHLEMADSLPEEAQHKWYIGKITLDVKKNFQDAITDSTSRRHLTIRHSGRQSPVRSRVILSNTRIVPRRPYSSQQHSDALSNLANLGLFSSVNMQFTPRDNDTLDLSMTCIMDKPYDFYIQAAYNHKLTGRAGPELKIGLTKKNAFRGGEKFDVNVHAAYEWEFGYNIFDKQRSAYEYGADASVEWPRLLVPFLKRRRFHGAPSTKASLSFDVINRPNYFRMHTAEGEWRYSWSPTAQSTHELSPLVVAYQRLNTTTAAFDSILRSNAYLRVAMQNMFIPKLQYTYIWTTDKLARNPVSWRISFTEAGNVISAFNSLFFREGFMKQGKTMFGNVYAQFLKIESNLRKTWMLTENSQIVGRINLGAAWSFGNMTQTPYTEQFYVGGANSIRAFPARGIGPGSYLPKEKNTSYIDQTGDILILLNLEYRRRIVGNLHGAVFLDAGNVWMMRHDDTRMGAEFTIKNFLREMALGTGIGIRYDLSFLVLRLDWGVGLHAPYDTGKGGFYNFARFKDSHTLHFAIGYPF